MVDGGREATYSICGANREPAYRSVTLHTCSGKDIIIDGEQGIAFAPITGSCPIIDSARSNGTDLSDVPHNGSRRLSYPPSAKPRARLYDANEFFGTGAVGSDARRRLAESPQRQGFGRFGMPKELAAVDEEALLGGPPIFYTRFTSGKNAPAHCADLTAFTLHADATTNATDPTASGAAHQRPLQSDSNEDSSDSCAMLLTLRPVAPSATSSICDALRTQPAASLARIHVPRRPSLAGATRW